jgi:TfoX/Sxy family transcriptional regulator of competence genes
MFTMLPSIKNSYIMAFNQLLAKRIRASLQSFPGSITEFITEKAMFGGLAFLYKGKMTVGIVKNDLMVRVVSEKMDAILKKTYVRPMDFTNRPMKEFIFVSPRGFSTEEELQLWIEFGIEHAQEKLK